MTHAEKLALYHAWRDETSDDWRTSLDAVSRIYLNDLDQMSANQLTEKAHREFDVNLRDITASIGHECAQCDRTGPAEHALADALMTLRYQLGMDRDTLAAQTGLPVEEITALECAKGTPSFATLNRIASATGTTIRMSFLRWYPYHPAEAALVRPPSALNPA